LHSDWIFRLRQLYDDEQGYIDNGSNCAALMQFPEPENT